VCAFNVSIPICKEEDNNKKKKKPKLYEIDDGEIGQQKEKE
jgi:hypothetical protein